MAPKNASERLVFAGQVAQEMEVSRETIMRYYRDGRIRFVDANYKGTPRFKLSEVREDFEAFGKRDRSRK